MTDTIYYDENYLEVTEHEIRDRFTESLNDDHEPITILGTSLYLGDVVHECDYNAWLEGFHGYVDNMLRNGELYEDESEFIDVLLDEWIDDNIPPHDTLDNASTETIHHELEDLYSSGVLELVAGELDIHPSYTIEAIVAMIVSRIECMN